MPIQYDANGIITQNLTEIIDEREQTLKPVMGEDFVIDKDTPIGNMELADATNELSIQELIAWLIPNMIDANTASGYFLDCICEKNRIYRIQPRKTKMRLQLLGTENTLIKKGDLTVSDELKGIYYNLNEDCLIGKDGTSFAEFECEYFGEFYPEVNAKMNIQTPLVGLNEVKLIEDKLDLRIGRQTESDRELRRRRMFSVEQNSTSTLGSMKSNIYSSEGVLHATYFENDTEATDLNGLPMKSFEFIVDGGDSKNIAQIIFNNKPAGTRAFGTTKVVVNDSEGTPHDICYTKADIVNIGMDIKVETSTAQSNLWKETVKKSIKAKFDDIQDIGLDVKDYNYFTVLTQYPEVSDIHYIKFHDVDAKGPVKYFTQFDIGKKQIAKLDIKNIVISVGE